MMVWMLMEVVVCGDVRGHSSGVGGRGVWW